MPAPPPVPAPAPTPPAQPGHYQGLTSQNETSVFDVTSDGSGVTHLATGQINEGCTPRATIYGNRADFGSYVKLSMWLERIEAIVATLSNSSLAPTGARPDH